MNYLIVGAGRIGSAMHKLLTDKKRAVFMHDTLSDAIKADCCPRFVIAAVPYKACLEVALWCAQTKIPGYIDFVEDDAVRTEIEALSKNYKDTCFIPCCGLAPGYVNIIAGRMMRTLAVIDSVKIYCGALPASRDEGYKLSWNVEGLINLYTNPCENINMGYKRLAAPLTGREDVVVDGVTYEAALTSGGLGTMAEEFPPRMTNMFYKTLRYPGHYDMVLNLIDKFHLDKEELVKLFEKLPQIGYDKVVIKIIVSGRREKDISVFSNITLTHEEIIFPEKSLTALQYATARGALMAIESARTWTSNYIKQDDL